MSWDNGATDRALNRTMASLFKASSPNLSHLATGKFLLSEDPVALELKIHGVYVKPKPFIIEEDVINFLRNRPGPRDGREK